MIWRHGLGVERAALHRHSDDALVQMAQQGGEEAFRALWARHSNWIRRFLSGYVSSGEDLDDLVQSVSLKIHIALGTYQAPSSFTRWASVICRNAGVDTVRRRNVRRSVFAAADLSESELPDSRFSPESVFDSAVLRVELREALKSLSPELRLTVALRYFGHMSTREAALKLDCPEGTVKSRLHTALRRLRAQIERMP
jgi:RNA polymerase sigma-70 factor, ECF subfamily